MGRNLVVFIMLSLLFLSICMYACVCVSPFLLLLLSHNIWAIHSTATCESRVSILTRRLPFTCFVFDP